MKYKVPTPAGYMYLEDERMVENAKSAFKNMTVPKNIDERNIIDSKAKSYHKTTTPWGVAYTRSYKDSCAIKAYFKRHVPARRFEIIDAD